jgi:hypothetical protein
MGKFNQVEFDSLSPYEQKQYEMDNPRQRAPRGSGFEPTMNRFFANASENLEGREKIEKATEAYRSKVGSDAGGKTIRGGGGGGGGAADMRFMKGIGNKPDATYKKGGKVSSASKRADGCAIRGKTKGRMV